MSRRYGRNQKRRAREALAQAQQASEMSNGLLRHMSRDNDHLRDQLRDVAHVLGVQFVGLDPQPIRAKLHDIERMRHSGYRMNIGNGAIEDVALLYAQPPRSPYDGMLHFKVELDGRYVGYALSQQALHHTPGEWLAERMGRELAHMLIHDIRAAKR